MPQPDQQPHGKMSFGSLDYIEDACDALDGSDFPYMIIAITGENLVHIASSLGDNAETVAMNVASGILPGQIMEHLAKFYRI